LWLVFGSQEAEKTRQSSPKRAVKFAGQTGKLQHRQTDSLPRLSANFGHLARSFAQLSASDSSFKLVGHVEPKLDAIRKGK